MSERAIVDPEHGETPSLLATGEVARPSELHALPAVQVEHLSKIYYPSPFWLRFMLRSAISEPVQALRDVSLTLRAGEVCAIVGPNGAGKSTLFRVITSLTTPTNGRVTVGGVDVMSDPVSARRQIGFVPVGDQTLYLRLSCIENLRFHGRLQGMKGQVLRRRIHQALETVGLTQAANRAGFALSAGMRARLLLARALLHSPKLLVLDEPTAAVDPVGASELLEVVQGVAHRSQVAILLSSHRLEEIEALQDRVAVLNRGSLIYDGNLGDFRRHYSQPAVQLMFRTVRAAERGASRLMSKGCDVELDLIKGTAHVRAQDVGVVLHHLGDLTSQIRSAEEVSASLRDVLREIAGGSAGPRSHSPTKA